MLWLLSSAFAESLLFQAERSTAFDDVVVSSDERWVAMGTGSTGQVHLLDVDSWTIQVMDACSGALGGLTFDGQGYLYTGCEGTGALKINPETMLVETEITLDAGALYYASVYNDNVYFLAENPGGGNPRIHLIDTQQQAEQVGGNFPTTLGYGAAKDMELVGNFFIVAHGATSISKVDPVSGGATRDMMGPTTGACEDVLPVSNATNALISGGTAGVYRFLFASNQLQFASMGSGLEQATALVAHQEELWVADSTADSLKSFTYNAGGASMGSEVLAEVPLNINRNVQEMVSTQGYIVAGTEDGAVLVVGNGPWVEVDDEEPLVLEDETSFSISFTSSLTGDYSILLHATNNDDGIQLASGSATAEEIETVDLVATDDFLEGDNALRVVVTTGDGTGHDTFTMTIDTPPATPTLTLQEVGYGDEQILLSGVAISDSDVSHYQVYISTEAFTSSDYDEGGPMFEVNNSDDLRIDVEPNQRYDWSIGELNNDQTYYIALRAFDDGGKFSPMSAVQSVIPKDTYSASQLTGEEGGFCGMPSPTDWLLLSLSTLLLTFRRRQVV